MLLPDRRGRSRTRLLQDTGSETPGLFTLLFWRELCLLCTTLLPGLSRLCSAVQEHTSPSPFHCSMPCGWLCSVCWSCASTSGSVRPYNVLMLASLTCVYMCDVQWLAHPNRQTKHMRILIRYSYNIAANADERRDNPTPAQQKINELLSEKRLQKDFNKS